MTSPNSKIDVVLVGTGIMSATLGALLKELDPGLTIAIYERLDQVAAESSDAWNNAGTGHAALCELNYTPQRADGTVEIAKAIQINESFELSKQFWAYLVKTGRIDSPASFINPVPHMSFVRGAANVAYLRKRHQALSAHHLFRGMAYSEDPAVLAQWMPLVMAERAAVEPLAATRTEAGTDVNFGALTRRLIDYLKGCDGVALHLSHDVNGLTRNKEGGWHVRVRDRASGTNRLVAARFVFVGAGGGALPLLQKSGVPEQRGFGGFPVSGQWLRCGNPEVIAKHRAKVYGLASVGTPPMSVPHLDTRVIDGKRELLFGPFAGFSTQFLKHGSPLDMPLSVRPSNLVPMLAAGLDNIDLTKYLIAQVLQSPAQRLAALKEFLPTARAADWRLEIAGQRVQVIKRGPAGSGKAGILQFGTEVICAADGSIAGLLGASPGASTSVAIMLDLMKNCFRDQLRSAASGWEAKLKQMIPSYGLSLAGDAALTERVRTETRAVLGLAADASL